MHRDRDHATGTHHGTVSTVENALRALVAEGYLERIGRGRATAYRRASQP